ncbi:hypothetical protein ACFFH4_26595 [Halalkalibacter alkalisediminis]|uniref:Ion transport domain-containing protein n=1 Tax=Halalkalibacter alkalisediminis TaxID=935616 RepID=A0ABV6NNY9_9BACI
MIAIIPFDPFFQIARFVRVMYFFRLKTITKFYIHPLILKVTYPSRLLLMLLLAFLSIESVIIWSIEENITTLSEAFYHVFF